MAGWGDMGKTPGGCGVAVKVRGVGGHPAGRWQNPCDHQTMVI